MKGEYVYKACLLQDESIQLLFQQRYNQDFPQREANIDIEEEWSRVESAVHKVSNEVLGRKRRYRRKRGLIEWTESLVEDLSLIHI